MEIFESNSEYVALLKEIWTHNYASLIGMDSIPRWVYRYQFLASYLHVMIVTCKP